MHDENRAECHRLNRHQLINEGLKILNLHCGSTKLVSLFQSVSSQWTSSVVITYADNEWYKLAADVIKSSLTVRKRLVKHKNHIAHKNV